MLTTDMVFAAAVVIIRIYLGLLFVGHGSQKLFGWFGGDGMERQGQMTRALGLHPVQFWSWTSALGEFLGGVSLVLGFLTPLGACAIIGSMLVAIAKVHAPKGLWNHKGGFEFNLLIILNALLAGIVGWQYWSVDQYLAPVMPISWGALLIAGLIVTLVGVGLALHSAETPAQQSPTHTPSRQTG